MRTELMPAFQMNETNLDQFVARICERRPKMLFGYPSAISHIAAHAQKRGVPLNNLGVKVVFCTSERLYDHQREAIFNAFGCPVANGYGGRDAGFIAHECSAGNMHITAEDIIVEIIDENGNIQPARSSRRNRHHPSSNSGLPLHPLPYWRHWHPRAMKNAAVAEACPY
jgi:phenylacetate-CoA ligase